MIWLAFIFCALLFPPALLCCLVGGWLLLFGLAALACWLVIGWWIWLAWLDWRRQAEYDDYV